MIGGTSGGLRQAVAAPLRNLILPLAARLGGLLTPLEESLIAFDGTFQTFALAFAALLAPVVCFWLYFLEAPQNMNPADKWSWESKET